MERIRALVVDDEPLARDGIRLLLQRDSQVEIVGECATGREAVAMIANRSPNLIFLDVQMPEMSGFEVLSRIRPHQMPAIIFVTAYDRYALRAFEVQALDYLLKPFTDQRFHAALRRAKKQLENGEVDKVNERLKALLASYQSQRGAVSDSSLEGQRSPRASYLERVMVKSGGRVFFFSVEEIDWFEAADYYVQLHVGAKSHLLRETLASLEGRLEPSRFLRIHRSIIVNLQRIREIQPERHGNYRVVLLDGTKLELSRRRRAKLRSLLKANAALKRTGSPTVWSPQ